MDSFKLAHLFLPHPHTHRKAHLLSYKALFVYILLFLSLQYGFTFANLKNPGVLGTSTSISVSEVIAQTNQKRAEAGLPPVKENLNLNKAAQLKAANMFAEDYWAHFSPSGKDPWGFINQAGYKFSYAGENLAKNFNNSGDVVVAWMNSPSHKENLLNPNYQDIGIAVEDGTLQGQPTTLVVQMFGKPSQVVAVAPRAETPPATVNQEVPEAQPVEVVQEPTQLAPETQTSPEIGQVANANTLPTLTTQPLVNSQALTRNLGLALFGLIGVLLFLDVWVLKKRGVFRFSSHHVAHMGLMAISGSAVLTTSAGQISEMAVSVIK